MKTALLLLWRPFSRLSASSAFPHNHSGRHRTKLLCNSQVRPLPVCFFPCVFISQKSRLYSSLFANHTHYRFINFKLYESWKCNWHEFENKYKRNIITMKMKTVIGIKKRKGEKNKGCPPQTRMIQHELSVVPRLRKAGIKNFPCGRKNTQKSKAWDLWEMPMT